MAERRMLAKSVIFTDNFLDMPLSARFLYVALNESADDDMKILIAKRYVLTFENGVIVIRHWRINNFLRSDRYTKTIYIDERSQLEQEPNRAYVMAREIEESKPLGIPGGIPDGRQTDDERETQDNIGKGSKGKGSKGKGSKGKDIDVPSVDSSIVCNEYESSGQAQEITNPDERTIQDTSSSQDKPKHKAKRGREKQVPDDQISAVIKAWDDMATASGLECVTDIEADRKKIVASRIRDYGVDKIIEAISKIPRNKSLMGINDIGWSANIDWLINPQKYSIRRINEGQFPDNMPESDKTSSLCFTELLY